MSPSGIVVALLCCAVTAIILLAIITLLLKANIEQFQESLQQKQPPENAPQQRSVPIGSGNVELKLFLTCLCHSVLAVNSDIIIIYFNIRYDCQTFVHLQQRIYLQEEFVPRTAGNSEELTQAVLK